MMAPLCGVEHPTALGIHCHLVGAHEGLAHKSSTSGGWVWGNR